MKVFLATLLLLPVIAFSQTSEQKQAALKKSLPGCDRFIQFNCNTCGPQYESIITCWSGNTRKYYYTSFAMKGKVLELKRVETVESNANGEKVKVKFSEASNDVYLLFLNEPKGKNQVMRLQKIAGSTNQPYDIFLAPAPI